MRGGGDGVMWGYEGVVWRCGGVRGGGDGVMWGYEGVAWRCEGWR